MKTLFNHNTLFPFSDFDWFFQPMGTGITDADCACMTSAPSDGSLRPASQGDWVPRFDVEENDEAYVLRGDVPGMKEKDIEIRVEDKTLTLRGERKWESDEARFNRRERSVGRFVRTFQLPENIDTDKVKATYESGVLELVLPKAEPVDNSRLIPIA